MKTQVHKINRFIQFAILSFTLLFAASSFAGSSKYYKPKDIVTIAASVDSFTTLVAALKAAGLVDSLQGDGPFTVLAPTNDAFAELPEQTLQNLLEPENRDKLTEILTYHVIPGKVKAKDVKQLVSAQTVQGEKVIVTSNHGQLFIDNAQVLQADINASNGVIHVIDKVILPRG